MSVPSKGVGGVTSARSGRPAVLRGSICDVVDDGTTLVGRQRPITFVDDGAAILDDLVPLLVQAGAVESLLATTGVPALVLAERRIDLTAAGGAPAMIEIEDSHRPGPLAGTTRRAHVAHKLLARFTHERLVPVQGQPLLHAGAVADTRGGCALLLGSSGAGKSTLVAHLIAAGHDLVNDEQVQVMPASGVVAGFTRPIAFKPAGMAHAPRDLADLGPAGGEFGALITAHDLGGRHRLHGRPRLVVVVERSADHDRPMWEELTAGQAVEAMCANNLDLAAQPVEALRGFAWLAGQVSTVRIRYADASAGAAAVGELLASPPSPPPPTGTVVDHALDPGAAPTTTSERWVPGPDVISVQCDAELVAYHRVSRSVVRLNAAAARWWNGDHHDLPRREIDEVVGQLRAAGFLR